METEDKNVKIKDRESWLKIGVIVFVSFVFGVPLFWNLITGNISLDTSEINFESILTLIVSFFSIFLSVFFYVKANESSHRFYNDSYNFTKDISETLRGIEAGFGEKLQNIDKGYDNFRRSFENYTQSPNKEEIAEEIDEEKNQIATIIEEKNQIIEELLAKSNLSQEVLKDYLSKINSKEKELNEKNNEIQKLKKEQNSDSSLDISSNSEFSIHNRMRRYIESNVFKKINPASAIRSRKYFLNKFNSLIPNLNRKFIYDMKNSNYIDENGLTDLGFHFIWQLIRKNRE